MENIYLNNSGILKNHKMKNIKASIFSLIMKIKIQGLILMDIDGLDVKDTMTLIQKVSYGNLYLMAPNQVKIQDYLNLQLKILNIQVVI